MNSILVSMDRTLKEYTRNRMIIVSTLGVPLFFLILLPVVMTDIPDVFMPHLKGFVTLTMITLLIMSVTQANLSGFIAADRERGLFRKIQSMPIKLWKECMGRIFAVWIFSFVCMMLIVLIGLIYGAKFNIEAINIIMCLGFLLLIGLAGVGTGLIIASFVKNESVATHMGVALTLIIFFLGGMAIPFSDLPNLVQLFAQIHPVPSATASIAYLFINEEFVGYNPLNIGQIIISTLLSVILFLSGIILYLHNALK
ncbi:MAG: ABC transporter permease [Candidatus Thorarchaeota archaeon]